MEAPRDTVVFTPGMVVTRSVKIAAGRYRASGAEGGRPADRPLGRRDPGTPLITVRGDDITLDLVGVTLEGIAPGEDPDRARGVAVRVEGGERVRIRGGTIRGYRFAVWASRVRGLTIVDADLSYNWKPRLYSLVGHESLVDWLSFHNNEDREWMRFGAAIYLEDVRRGRIQGVRAVQGMNGLLMTRTDSVAVLHNDFSYNSGLGIGLYRSNHNLILMNRAEYDVRGYSEGFYERGQDSAGILVYEQSGGNIIAGNAATHSGDGFFLWAGNVTMNTGRGGANDNLIFYNDFSWPPTNAVEATFSRNRIVGNFLGRSRYGVWGGYSWETEIRGNCFASNRYAVGIEHGQENVIQANEFRGDSIAVALWARASQPEGWGYPLHRDVRSRDHVIADNLFASVAEIWRLDRTGGHLIGHNVERSDLPESSCDPAALLGAGWDSLTAEVAARSVALAPEGEGETLAAEVEAGAPPLDVENLTIPWTRRSGLPRSAIVVDAWGPWDGRSPKLWPTDTTWSRVPLAVLGPPGRWRLLDLRGVEEMRVARGASARGAPSEGEDTTGRTGDTLWVTPRSDSLRDWSVTLEYVGEATVSPRGVTAGAGTPIVFTYTRFAPLGPWDVAFFSPPPAADPAPSIRPGEAREAREAQPFLRRTLERLDLEWYAPTISGVPRENWGLTAATDVTLPAGEYTLRTISDDGVRVWVDGALVINAWGPHGSRVDSAPLTGGSHHIEVRYHQRDGWTELRVEVVRGRVPR
ncbi:MAG: NosD domain-containing protein [Gemmatimonadota bacterium]